MTEGTERTEERRGRETRRLEAIEITDLNTEQRSQRRARIFQWEADGLVTADFEARRPGRSGAGRDAANDQTARARPGTDPPCEPSVSSDSSVAPR
jgi:hypothetical protein